MKLIELIKKWKKNKKLRKEISLLHDLIKELDIDINQWKGNYWVLNDNTAVKKAIKGFIRRKLTSLNK